ncbi:MAG: fibronectin type III domain-containing protein [Candidatus Electryoneaceae bacterium]|nr:fibronectin type III domain-containing protein [Candidatus Electryoneaceae bacterium]
MKPLINIFKVFLLFLLLSTQITCDFESPTAPVHDNPLDPENPETGGTPYNLQAEMTADGVRLNWSAIEWLSLTGYNLYRRVDDDDFVNIQQTATSVTTYLDTDIHDGHRYGYYVLAIGYTGESERNDTTTAMVNSNPIIIIEADTVTHTPTRNVTLKITGFGAERMLLSDTSTFIGSQWQPFADETDWQLVIGAGTKPVYLQIAYQGNDTSDVVSDNIESQLARADSLIIATNSDTVETNLVTVNLYAEFADSMQISRLEDFSDALWISYQESFASDLFNYGFRFRFGLHF